MRLFFDSSIAVSFVVAQTALSPMPTLRRLTKRQTFGLKMLTSTGITLTVDRKLTARATIAEGLPGTTQRRCSVKNAHQKILDDLDTVYTRARYLPRYDRREGYPSVPTNRRHRSRLLRAAKIAK
jgi:hypothetical protein